MAGLTEKQISEGWRVVKFGEIARSISIRVDPTNTDLLVYVGLEHLDPDNLRITRKGVPSDVKGQKLLVKPGQIIFGKRRAYQRKVAVADFEGICSAHAMVLEAIPDAVVPEYLPFFMQSDMFMERAVAISEGSLSPTIKWKILANQEFPLPPRARQEEMLEVFEKSEELVEKQKKIWIDAQRAKIKIAYDRMLQGNWFSEIFGSKKATFPLDWKIMTCKDVIKEIQYGLSKSLLLEGEYSILRMMNFKNGYVSANDLKYINLSKNEFKKYQLRKGDLLFNRTNSMEWVGRTGQFALDSDKFVFASYLLRLQIKEGLITTSYLNQYLNLPLVQYRLKAYATPGVNQANINPKSLCKLRIPVPPMTYILETESILQHFDMVIESAERSYNHALKCSSQIKNIMFEKTT